MPFLCGEEVLRWRKKREDIWMFVFSLKISDYIHWNGFYCNCFWKHTLWVKSIINWASKTFSNSNFSKFMWIPVELVEHKCMICLIQKYHTNRKVWCELWQNSWCKILLGFKQIGIKLLPKYMSQLWRKENIREINWTQTRVPIWPHLSGYHVSIPVNIHTYIKQS